MDMNGIRAGCGWNASDEKIIHHNLIVSDASISDRSLYAWAKTVARHDLRKFDFKFPTTAATLAAAAGAAASAAASTAAELQQQTQQQQQRQQRQQHTAAAGAAAAAATAAVEEACRSNTKYAIITAFVFHITCWPQSVCIKGLFLKAFCT